MTECTCLSIAEAPVAADLASLQAEGLGAGLDVSKAARRALLLIEAREHFRATYRRTHPVLVTT